MKKANILKIASAFVLVAACSSSAHAARIIQSSSLM